MGIWMDGVPCTALHCGNARASPHRLCCLHVFAASHRNALTGHRLRSGQAKPQHRVGNFLGRDQSCLGIFAEHGGSIRARRGDAGTALFATVAAGAGRRAGL